MIGPIIALVGLLASSPPSASAPVIHQPTGKWIADFEAQDCVLSRAYGTEHDQLYLAFQQWPMAPGIEIDVLKSTNRYNMHDGTAQIGVGQGEVTPAKFSAFTTSGNPLRRVEIEIEDDSYKTAAATGVISVSVPDEFDETFAVPDLNDALKVLNDCVVDLGKSWGFSAVDQERVGKAAKPLKSVRDWFDASDYPVDALEHSVSGRSQVRLDVDANGIPSNCVLIGPSGNSSLDDVTCSILLKRARFHPALDHDGKAMKSVVVQTVDWLMR